MLLSLVSFSLPSCKSDVKPQSEVTQNQLTGKWLVHEGYRSGNRSKLLDNGYFEFMPEGYMKTNILGDESQQQFSLDKGVLLANNDKFIVSKLTSDTLILEATLRNFEFKFVTLKQ